MDPVEDLLRATLADAARSAPNPIGVAEAPHSGRRHRTGLIVATVAAAVAIVVGIGTTATLLHRTPTSTVHPAGTTGPARSGVPYPLGPGVYLSGDHRTLYGTVTESVVARGTPCWAYVNGSAQIQPNGIASISLSQQIVGSPGQKVLFCAQPAVSGPWYVQVHLPQPYDKPYVVDHVGGVHRRIIGVIHPTRNEIVNGP